MCPRPGFRSRRTCECILVPVFVPGEHPNVPRSGFRSGGTSAKTTLLENHPFVNPQEELKGDHEIVMTAVSEDGRALEHATEELKGDHEIVLAAVSENGCALQYAAEELKGDREILMTAVSQNGIALRYAPQDWANPPAPYSIQKGPEPPQICQTFVPMIVFFGVPIRGTQISQKKICRKK